MQLSWPPRVDGKFITDNPYKLVQQGNVADIPFVTGKNQPSSLSSLSSYTHQKGTCDDEGTFFSFGNLNITWILHSNISYNSSLTYTNIQQRSESQFRDYVRTMLLQGLSDENTARFAALYTQNVTRGSPFDTGLSNAYTPQFKRLAAVQGDQIFQAPRRHFQQHRSGKQNMWTFCPFGFFLPPWAHDEC